MNLSKTSQASSASLPNPPRTVAEARVWWSTIIDHKRYVSETPYSVRLADAYLFFQASFDRFVSGNASMRREARRLLHWTFQVKLLHVDRIYKVLVKRDRHGTIRREMLERSELEVFAIATLIAGHRDG